MRCVKTLSLIALSAPILAFLAPAQAQTESDQCVGKPGNARAYITVGKIRSSQGQIAVTVYPDIAGRFLRRKGSHYVRFVPANAPQTRFCILLPDPGVYAIAIYHDANANRKLDKFGIGLPSEGFGFSNDAPTLFGLPQFSKVRIRLADGMETRIALRYLRGDELSQ